MMHLRFEKSRKGDKWPIDDETPMYTPRIQSALRQNAKRVGKDDCPTDEELGKTPMGRVALEICKKNGATFYQVLNCPRVIEAMHARQEICWSLSKLGKSSTQIGMFLGGRGHSVIQRTIKTYERRINRPKSS